MKNKKAAMLLYLATLALVMASFAFLMITVMQKPAKFEPRYIGEHQIALLKTAVQSQKFLLYIDQAADSAATQSLYDLAEKGGFSSSSACGSYFGYEAWKRFKDDGTAENCFPDEKTIRLELANSLGNEIYKYLNIYWGKASSPPFPKPEPKEDTGNKKDQGNQLTASTIIDIAGNAVTEPTLADKPLGALGKMPQDNYEVTLEQKDKLKITAVAKENAKFDIILGKINRKGIAGLAEQIESITRKGMKIVDFQDCKIKEPQTDSQSIGSTSASSGRLENGVKIPFEGPYHLVNPVARPRKRNYATNELYVVIQKVGCATMQAYNTKIIFNDVSKKGGGSIGHKSHASGRDVDLGFICQKDGRRYPCYKKVTTSTGVIPEFDPAGNWIMVKTMFQEAKVRFIFLNPKIIKSIIGWAEVNEPDKELVKKAKTQLNAHAMNNHVTHYHLRIQCPEGDTKCRT